MALPFSTRMARDIADKRLRARIGGFEFERFPGSVKK
jgi:hypothetical protein